MERRRSRRFTQESIAVRLVLVRRAGTGPQPHACVLQDLSFGGMCFRAEFPLHCEETHYFLLDFQDPFHALVLVKARLRWTRSSPQGQLWGAEFLESSQGWLGPEEESFGAVM